MINLNKSINELKNEFGENSFFKVNPIIKVINTSSNECFYNKFKNELIIKTNDSSMIFRLIYETFNYDFSKDFYIKLTKKIEKLSIMVDMARNNVLKVDTIKKLIRYLAIMGYSKFKIYLEDVFDVIDEPYFGYLRGKYKKEELIEVVNYASIFGIEVIPCIQTLAHLNCLQFFCMYRWNFDIDDILLVDSDITIRLITNMIKTLKDIFKTDVINIGMDEAHHLGRGKYLDKYGYEDRFKIFAHHLNKVLEIAKKYGFKCEMWSDMFFDSTYYSGEDTKKHNYLNDIDKDLTLIYWDYNANDVNYFDKKIKQHLEITKNISVAGGAWKRLGHAPNNTYSIVNLKNFIEASYKNKIKEFMITCWGDNGGEASIFSILPSLSYASNFNYLEIKDCRNHLFYELSTLKFDDFIKLDYVNKTREEFNKDDLNSLSRIYLYNDLLLGVYDTCVNDNQSTIYKNVSIEFANFKENNKFGYIFDTLSKLADLLSIKVDLGIKLRKAYKDKNEDELKHMINLLNELDYKIDIFYDSFYEQWNKESKSNGFDVQDLRIGGIKQRIKTVKRKINDYLDKKITNIEELEEDLLDFYGQVDNYFKPISIVDSRYRHMCSVNVND